MPSTRTLRRAATASALVAVCTGALSGCLFLPLVDGVTTPLKEREPRSSSPVPSEPEPDQQAPEPDQQAPEPDQQAPEPDQQAPEPEQSPAPEQTPSD